MCGLSVFLSALTYPLARYWYNRNWRKIYENELFEQKMLRWVVKGVGHQVVTLCALAACYKYLKVGHLAPGLAC